jgi:ArsR family transcriptional regulator
VDLVKKQGVKATDGKLRKRVRIPDAKSLDRASRLFKAISDVSRLRLLALLAHGEVCVTDLAETEGVNLSTISHRLRVLRNENIVLRRRRGKQINYALADRHILDLVFTSLAHAGEESDRDAGRPEPQSRTRISKRHSR